jgi:penicillin-binding protein 2D
MQVVRQPFIIRMIKWIFKMSVFLAAVIMLVASVVLLSLLYLRSQALPPSSYQETTTIYAEDGQVLDMIHQGQNRTYVPLEYIPDHLRHAFLAVEDRNFYNHFGFDVKRIGGAVLANIRNRSFVEGASTITQQLARNLYLDHDKTIERKVREAIYTAQLEMHYSKDDIFEQYLNQIYFGHSAYGVEAAAHIYFGKSVQELSLAESVLIAGIPKGPRYFSPWLNEENAKNRQELILHLMYRQGYISEAELNAALQERLRILDESHEREEGEMAPYFRDYVRKVVTTEMDIPEEVFDQGGLSIYTTLDADMQEKAEQKLRENLPEDRPLQGALLAIESETGYIKAMVGGKDYAESPYNRVFANRHPGSAFKPLLYYTALENGFTPMTLMRSEPTTFMYDEDQEYTPRNFNDRYAYGDITLERAIAQSDNIYAVKTLMHLGEQAFVDQLPSFGFDRSFQPLPSLALGAQNVTLYEMVEAYSVFANEGMHTEPVTVLQVKDATGNVLAQSEELREQVLDSGQTFILNRMLRSVFEPGGTGHRVSSLVQRPVSGKTGSTDTDSWMLGFTPQLTAGVWVGYDEGELINHNNDGRLSAEIWAEFMEEALYDQPPALFDIPEGLRGAYINPESGKLATEHCPVKRLLYFKEGTEPTEYCPLHVPEGEEETAEITEREEGSSTMCEKLLDWWQLPVPER